MKFIAGQRIHYLMTATTTGGDLRSAVVTTSMPFTYHVLDVRNGIATIDTTVGPMDMDGKQMVAAQSLRMRIDHKGRATGAQALLNDMGGLSPAIPPHPMRVGDWYNCTEIPSPLSAIGAARTTNRYTFLGFKTINRTKCAVFSYAGIGKKLKSTTEMTGTLLLSVADGTLIAESATLRSVSPAGGQSIAVTQKLTVTRR